MTPLNTAFRSSNGQIYALKSEALKADFSQKLIEMQKTFLIDQDKILKLVPKFPAFAAGISELYDIDRQRSEALLEESKSEQDDIPDF